MKKKLIKSLKTGLKGIDSFGQPIYLSYRGKTQYKTKFGGILTLILVGAIIAFSFESMISLLVKENIKLSSSTTFESDPKRLELSRGGGFSCSIGLSPDIFNNITRRHFEIVAESRETVRHLNGTEIKTNLRLKLVQCQQDHFPEDYNYVKYGQQNWWCFELNQTLVLEGRYESDLFRHVKINFQRCVNTTENNNFCAPPEETESLILKNDGKIYAKIIFSNKIINLQDFKKPYIDFMEQSTFFLMDPKRFFKQTDIFFKINNIKQDDNIFYNMFQESNIITFDNFREQISNLNSNVYASLYLRVSVNRTQYLASSEKLTTILSRIGGLASVLFSLIQIIALSYNRQKLLLSLSNFLYNTISPKEEGFLKDSLSKSTKVVENAWGDEQSKRKESELILTSDKQLLSNNVEAAKYQPKIQSLVNWEEVRGKSPAHNTRRYSKLLDQIDRHLKKFTKLKFSWKYFLHCFCLMTKNYRNRTILLRKSMKKIDRDMDIIQILMKVKEVEKLKKFLFDPNQRILFEFFPKPIITTSLKKNTWEESNDRNFKKSSLCYLHNDYLKKIITMSANNDKSILSVHSSTSKLYIQLFRSYKSILEGEENQEKTNKKLISLLGEDLLRIFRAQDEYIWK